jgi:hypothetical protein
LTRWDSPTASSAQLDAIPTKIPALGVSAPGAWLTLKTLRRALP